MDETECRIAFQLGIDDDTHGVKVVDLIKALVLIEHLTVNAVYRFDTALQSKMDMIFG